MFHLFSLGKQSEPAQKYLIEVKTRPLPVHNVLRQARAASGGARTRDRRVPADLRADSLATVLPTPRIERQCPPNKLEWPSGLLDGQSLRKNLPADLFRLAGLSDTLLLMQCLSYGPLETSKAVAWRTGETRKDSAVYDRKRCHVCAADNNIIIQQACGGAICTESPARDAAGSMGRQARVTLGWKDKRGMSAIATASRDMPCWDWGNTPTAYRLAKSDSSTHNPNILGSDSVAGRYNSKKNIKHITFLSTASPQQGDLRLSGEGGGGETRTRNRGARKSETRTSHSCIGSIDRLKSQKALMLMQLACQRLSLACSGRVDTWTTVSPHFTGRVHYLRTKNHLHQTKRYRVVRRTEYISTSFQNPKMPMDSMKSYLKIIGENMVYTNYRAGSRTSEGRSSMESQEGKAFLKLTNFCNLRVKMWSLLALK
ncbi:hypothetical protein PoB_007147800 [Plakobranchus ocellatus]|uniref:Uncharacterized protein n=1 Tax=Plakobranchus ocellatus TaxID=259542 RepID=A0AAV4DL10_9GAST|nr:hypothetical protein PoB_007147800 [Plakobranchus ocellatus]